ncbi:MAG: hypothetical protein ACFE8E_02830 [Candidatus Hodarchaeota archaeon]
MPPSDKFQLLLNIIHALEKFQDHPQAQFNFSKLCKGLKLLPKEGEELLDMIFRFQSLFRSHLEGFTICKKRRNTTLYLTLKAQSEVEKIETAESHEITINIEHSNVLSDIIYYFQHINIGKGFNLNQNNSELIHKVKHLKNNHPYFFEHRGNGLTYPTKLAIDLGTHILSYKRGNKPIRKINLLNYKITIQN